MSAKRAFFGIFQKLVVFCCAVFFCFANAFSANLPSGYTELEYIESTGTQYIDTGFSPDANTSVDWKGQLISGSSGVLLGARVGGSNPGRFFPFAFSTGTLYRTTYGAHDVNVSADTSTVCTGSFRPSESKSIINGTTYSFVSPNFSKTESNNLLLFGVNGYGDQHYLSTGKIWYVKIWDNNTLVRNLVPAKNSSGVVGMYDTVNNVFYQNAGTGEFIGGQAVCSNGELAQIYTSATGTVTQNGTPSPTNPIEPTFYQQGDMILRKVGNIADSYDATTGKITRRIGVTVFKGTENWPRDGNSTWFYFSGVRTANIGGICTHGKVTRSGAFGLSGVGYIEINTDKLGIENSADAVKQWLAQQYAAGTPVTVYYPLETETTEDIGTTYCAPNIKIATTAYNAARFSPIQTDLNNAVATIREIVTKTINQTAAIASLQADKQTRPEDACPAGKKCLLVETEENGVIVPHWFPIIESPTD